MVTAAVHADLVESPQDAMKWMGQSKNRRLQEAFAAHLRHLGRVDPRDKHERVVLIVDNAPRQAGQVVSEALADNPHLEFKRLPSSSPRLNALGRSWRVLRRRAPTTGCSRQGRT